MPGAHVMRFEARPGSTLADELCKFSYEVTRVGESARIVPNDTVEVIAATCRPSSSGPGPKQTSVPQWSCRCPALLTRSGPRNVSRGACMIPQRARLRASVFSRQWLKINSTRERPPKQNKAPSGCARGFVPVLSA
jgi:hypothetical protein